VQEGIEYPPPPSGSEPEDIDHHQDALTEEVRDLFASDAVEEA
jgi:hypothetical protein